ncbi:MAG: bifunctional proline dehydrogenase/L-glutamate gamma-semialdehyde dehydrogenase PutA [Pseudomonadota bacterium]
MAFDEHSDLKRNHQAISALYIAPEPECAARLAKAVDLSLEDRTAIAAAANKLVTAIRRTPIKANPIDRLLSEYSLSSKEGVALMRLSEALIRTPDFDTARTLIRDKLHRGDWRSHMGTDRNALVNGASAGLMLTNWWIAATGDVSADNPIARLGDRAVTAITKRAMSLIGNHFVLSETIDGALRKTQQRPKDGGVFSFDMLGEAARTDDDAELYFQRYLAAADKIATTEPGDSLSNNISIKLSALHPRYELNKLNDCGPALVEKVLEISDIAREAGFTITIDAEEADRLEASLAIFERLALSDAIAGWDGLGIVVQAYQKRAPAVIDWLIQLARNTNRRIPIRLVKGAYWDTEIKRAQELGLDDYPVFTQKQHTDISYLACTRQLLDASDYVYPQFATHNANSTAAILHMAYKKRDFEFQRLHGMGEALHDVLIRDHGALSRVYAPVGDHKELLPYLVRRLLENGANSSFVNQLQDKNCDPETLSTDVISESTANEFTPNPKIKAPRDHLENQRLAAAGSDWTQLGTAERLSSVVNAAVPTEAATLVDGVACHGAKTQIVNPAKKEQVVGVAYTATPQDIERAIDAAAQSNWRHTVMAYERASTLNVAADMLEAEEDRFINLCVYEAGKTIPDAIAEIREAVDFLRYYASQACREKIRSRTPLGVIACISPWNFPLAIFLGQASAALSVGNTVIAKPADQTPLIASEAVKLLHRAGVPTDALHLVIGSGREVGENVTRHQKIAGICFTGSTATARRIALNLADTGHGHIPFIAETGGINAMIVDSSALLEQSVRDVVASAFQSAGQRCSACRIIAIQSDIAVAFETMLRGAVNALSLGDPKDLATDAGPVIDEAAYKKISAYVEDKKSAWPVIAEYQPPLCSLNGFFIPPIAFRVGAVADVTDEIFGPILHVVRFESGKLNALVEDINNLGYGLTMGLHTRIDSRIDRVRELARAGNLYVNRNQVGAVVGVQPFGGEGLSGTGPKAGGPHYLMRLTTNQASEQTDVSAAPKSSPSSKIVEGSLQGMASSIKAAKLASTLWTKNKTRSERISLLKSIAKSTFSTVPPALLAPINPSSTALPGPTGEDNTLWLAPRGVLLSLGAADLANLLQQFSLALAAGNAVLYAPSPDDNAYMTEVGRLADALPRSLITIVSYEQGRNLARWYNPGAHIDGVIADDPLKREVSTLLCNREGPILPLLSSHDDPERFFVERTLTIDTTAAGGNASLLAGA